MFDIGFSEIVVIAVVALVVLGPEKLPKTARTLGHLFGRLQRYVNDVKADIKREVELDELRKLQQTVQSAATEIQTSIVAARKDVESHGRDVEAALSATAHSPKADPAAVAPTPQAPTAPTQAPAASQPTPPDAPQQASLPGFDRG